MKLKIITTYQLLDDEEVLRTYEVETTGDCNATDSFQRLVDINEGKLGAVERKLGLDILDGVKKCPHGECDGHDLCEICKKDNINF